MKVYFRFNLNSRSQTMNRIKVKYNVLVYLFYLNYKFIYNISLRAQTFLVELWPLFFKHQVVYANFILYKHVFYTTNSNLFT